MKTAKEYPKPHKVAFVDPSWTHRSDWMTHTKVRNISIKSYEHNETLLNSIGTLQLSISFGTYKKARLVQVFRTGNFTHIKQWPDRTNCRNSVVPSSTSSPTYGPSLGRLSEHKSGEVWWKPEPQLPYFENTDLPGPALHAPTGENEAYWLNKVIRRSLQVWR